jgi:hypothetical protein
MLPKGFQRPIRTVYLHRACGGKTIVSKRRAEAFARNPALFAAAYCNACRIPFDLVDEHGQVAFRWADGGSPVGS